MSTSAYSAAVPSRGTAKRRLIGTGLAASLLLSCSPVALHAETNADLAREIAELKAQIREMKGAISETRGETRRTAAKVKAVASRGPEGYMPPYANPIPVGATPAFVTADKKFQFGAITITPGGFIAAESVYRSRSLQSDMITNYAIPFPNNIPSHSGEFRPSARQTRLALLAEAPITPTFLAAGYVELDFLGAASTANENQTNSYTPRIRHLYATLDNSEWGMHVLAGQNWSLATLNSKGITPRNEVTPNVIDAQQVVGSVYARQAQIRLTKDFDKKLWLALSIEEGQTTGCPAAAVGGAAGAQAIGNGLIADCSATGTGGAFVGAAQAGPQYSLNQLPDVIGKVAYEAKLGDHDVHLEALGMYTSLHDTVQQANFLQFQNRNTSGYGVGAGVIAAVIPKTLDFQVNGLYGKGINRYGPSQLPSATFNADGSLRAVEGYIAMAGLTWHATPSIDLYSYAGIEGEMRTAFPGQAGFAGIGGPTTNNDGCFIEGSTACTGATKTEYEVTAGFWDKLYKGSFGEVRVGAQYSYINRQLFSANNTFATVAAAGPVPLRFVEPQTQEHMFMTSLRYFPFAADPIPVAPVVAKY